MTFDGHTLALVSVVGNAFDALGAMYLAYDLLGGEHGPLRTLTRGVTYGTLFGVGYGVALGPIFGLATGVTHAITLAWEFSRASKGRLKSGFRFDAAMSAIRGVGFAVGAAYLYGAVFGVTFGLLSAVGQIVAYQAGMRPTIDYEPGTRPRMTRTQFLGAVNRTIGYTAAGYISALIAHQRSHAMSVGLRAGLVIGVVTAIGGSCTPFVEWFADRMPQKRMGVLGIGLILAGFGLQSIQYWVALLGIGVGGK